MSRWIAIVSAFVVASTLGVSTLGVSAGQARGGGNGGARQQELQSARSTMQQHVTELKRLEAQLKLDRRAGDKAGIERDQDAIKMTRVLIRQDQDRIRQLLSDRPNRGGGNGSGGGRGRRGQSV